MGNRGPILIFLISRIIVFLAFVLTPAYGLGYGNLLQWDGKVYLDIAENGYNFTGDPSNPLLYTGQNSHIAMLPLFPILIRLVADLTGFSFLNSALILNFILGMAAAILLWHLINKLYDQKTATASVILFSFFPYSVFLTMPYTESLAFLLIFTVLYSLLTGNRLHTTIALSLLLITRIPGFIILPIVYLYWLKEKRSFLQSSLLILLSLLPFLLYLLFQYNNYGTPWAFMIAQKINWHHEATWPWLGIKKFWPYVTGHSSIMWKIDFAWLCIMTATVLAGIKQKLPWHFTTFSAGIIILSVSSTYILGMGRYLMAVISFYPLFGGLLAHRPVFLTAVTAIMSAWLFLNSQLIYLSKMIF